MKPASPCLRIDEPCHESWDGMTANAAGRHCAACDKTVVDVTAMAPAVARAYVAAELPARLAKGERICVRAHADRRGRLLRPGTTRRMLTNGLALMLATVGGLMAADTPEIEPMMGKIACPVDPLAPVNDAESGISVRVDAEAKLLIASDAAGTERWRVAFGGKPRRLSLNGAVVTVTYEPATPDSRRDSLSADIRTGAVHPHQ